MQTYTETCPAGNRGPSLLLLLKPKPTVYLGATNTAEELVLRKIADVLLKAVRVVGGAA